MILYGSLYDNYAKVIISTNQTNVPTMSCWGSLYGQQG